MMSSRRVGILISYPRIAVSLLPLPVLRQSTTSWARSSPLTAGFALSIQQDLYHPSVAVELAKMMAIPGWEQRLNNLHIKWAFDLQSPAIFNVNLHI
jgi:hypothetical protein